MSRRILLINIILVIFVIVEIFSVIQLWSRDVPLTGPVSKNSVKPLKFKNVRLLQERGLPISAYNDIIGQNLFSNKRKEYVPEVLEPDLQPELEVEKESEIKTLNTNRIVLYGVIIIDDFKKALVTDIDKISQSNSIWVENGDSVGNFMIKSIEEDRVIVTNSGKKFSILLYDKNNPKKRKFIQKRIVPKKKVRVNSPAKPVKQVKPAKRSVSAKKNNDEYETISTPFGDFKRKKKK